MTTTLVINPEMQLTVFDPATRSECEISVKELIQKLTKEAATRTQKRSEREIEKMKQRQRSAVYWARFQSDTIAQNYKQFEAQYNWYIKNMGKKPPINWMIRSMGWSINNYTLNRRRVVYLETEFWDRKENREKILMIV